MTTCYIGIGSNLGDRRSYIERALGELEGLDGVTVTRVSSIYETEPVSDIPQGMFLNGVAEITASCGPLELLRRLLAIEEKLGRTRGTKDAPRTIDLDILYYGEERVNEDGLVIPHPRIGEREFVLRGLRELGKAHT